MTASNADWDLTAGARIRRTELHERYGGGGQGGISPSARTRNVLIFSDPRSGEQYGYVFDGWRDGVYHYTGEGQIGDQRMQAGNKAIRDHAHDGRRLRVFNGVSDVIEYEGEFELAGERAFYYAEAPDRNGDLRQVIVFRLVPVSPQITVPADPGARSPLVPATASSVREVPVEEHQTDSSMVQPSSEPRESIRREQPLVRDLQRHLERRGHNVMRLLVRPADEVAGLVCDLFDKSANVLYEAKGSGTRQAIRMAIGQLADYSRFAPAGVRRVVLLSERPRPDLERLLTTQGIAAVWRADAGGFADNAGGELTG